MNLNTTIIKIKNIITSRLFKQLFRFGIAGSISFVVDYSIFLLLINVLKVHYILAALISFIISAVVNWLINTTWVFDQRKVERRTTEALLFVVIAAVGLGINELTLFIGVERLHYSPEVSKIVATAIVSLWNFIIRKLILYK